MNQLLLRPTDVLFFKDGRPMSGSLSGHGAAWPLPTVTSAALHAALWRAGIEGVHEHRRGRSGQYSNADKDRDRKFGSLKTAGPFPVCPKGSAATWFFPRPLDAGILGEITASFLPLAKGFDRAQSSLPQPLQFAVANTEKATKDQPKSWWSEGAWNTYLGTKPRAADAGRQFFKSDSDFADTESTFGIGIDPETATQDGERFYSAHYLRLRDGWGLGRLAEAEDKEFKGKDGNNDLVKAVFPNSGSQTPVIVGGQQRLCTVRCDNPTKLPLPLGKVHGFKQEDPDGKATWLVKWVLLTPGIFPQLDAHPGGWLPSWIRHTDGAVMLKFDCTERKIGEGRTTWRKRIAEMPSIPATLVAAIIGKPIHVTGYALDNGLDDRAPGPKPTHLAVPAGSVYYFKCTDEAAAQKLAAALNWHGCGDPSTIRNRRSTLMGEKGFGLGVCGTWSFHNGQRPD